MSSRDLDLAIARLARRQHLVFTRAQALAAGATDAQIRSRIALGLWVVLEPGVYSPCDAPPTWERQVMAAVLAAGPGAVASHRTAAALHGIDGFRHLRPEVLIPRGRRATTGLADVRTTRDLIRRDVCRVDGIPATTVARTLCDLAATVPSRAGAALDDALAARLVTADEFEATAERLTGRGRRGSAELVRLVTEHAPGLGRPASELERVVLEQILDYGLVRPTLQWRAPWREERDERCDMCWEPQMTILENDSRRWHTRQRDFEEDKRRDRKAVVHGYGVMRVTWADTRHPESYLADLAARIPRLAA